MKNTRKINLQLFAEPKTISVENRFEIKTDSDVAEMYLYGTIRKAYPWEEEGNCISSKGVLKLLKEVGDKDVNVHLNSGGGDAFESIAIYNTLKEHKGKVNIIVDALAGSGGSVIAMAGDTVKLLTGAMMMVHKASTICYGNSIELKKQAEDLDKLDTSIKSIYKKRFVGTDEELEQLVADESWLTVEECVTFGFADSEKEDETTNPSVSVKENLFNKYKKDIVVDTGEKGVGCKDNSNLNILKRFKKTGGNE